MNEGPVNIHVENFKSLKEFTLECRKFNVLIGVNGSGKTSILELFKFVNLCIDPVRIPPYPFGPWSGYKNIVWSADTTLPISIEVKYSMEQHNIDYKMSIDGSSGKLEFVSEELAISHYIHIERTFQDVAYKLDTKFLKQLKSNFDFEVRPIGKRIFQDVPKKEWIEKLDSSISIIKHIRGFPIRRFPSAFFKRKLYEKRSPSDKNPVARRLGPAFVVSYSDTDTARLIPSILIGDRHSNDIIQSATSLFSGDLPMIFLRQLNYKNLRTAPSVNDPPGLDSDGAGLISLLFRWYTSSSNELPSRFERAIKELFPGWQISFLVTDDGRILLQVDDGSTTLSPPSIPDGFYKLLVILAAVEQNPRFLLIDEIETSLHAEILEYVIDELYTCDSRVLITTHSPLVIDAVELEDVIMLERTASGTIGKRIENVEQMKTELHDKGLTLSENWIYR